MEGLPKWLIFHVAFGAVPYFASVALRYFKDGGENAWRSSPEIIFLVVVASASALGEIAFSRRKPVRWRHFCQIALAAGAIAGAMLYGAYLSEELNSPGSEAAVDCDAVVSQAPVPSSFNDSLLDSIRLRWRAPCSIWWQRRERYFAFSKTLA